MRTTLCRVLSVAIAMRVTLACSILFGTALPSSLVLANTPAAPQNLRIGGAGDPGGPPQIVSLNLPDEPVQGAPASITGLNFGAKAPAAPLHWDDFSEGQVGADIRTPSQGIAYAQATSGITTYTNEACYSGVLCVHSHSTPAIGGVGLAVMVAEPQRQLFGSAKIKLRSSDGSVGYIGSKYFRINTNSDGSFVHGLPSFDLDLRRALLTDPPTPQYSISASVNQQAGGWNFTGYEEIPHDQWVEVSSWARAGDVDQANGLVGRSFFGSVAQTSGVTLNSSAVLNGYRNVAIVAYIDRNAAPGRIVEIYIDDVYIDRSLARVVLTENADWQNHGREAFQIPTSWSSTSVEFKLNLGGFTTTQINNGLYLHVLNADGVVSNPMAVSF